MLNTLGIVEVHSCANLAKHPASRRLGGKSLLEWIVRRMSESQRLDCVIALAPQSEEFAELANLVPYDVPLLLSNRTDALGRLLAALDEFPAHKIVRLSAEHPFVDPVLIDRLVSTACSHPESDYIGYCSTAGRLAMRSPLCEVGELIRAETLRSIDKKTSNASHRQQVASYMHGHPEQFNLRLIPIPASMDRNEMQFTIRGEEEWEHMQTIFDALGPEALEYHRIFDLFEHQAAIRKRKSIKTRAANAA